MDRQVIVRVSQARDAAQVRVAREVMVMEDTVQAMADTVMDMVVPRVARLVVQAAEERPQAFEEAMSITFLAKQVEEDMVEDTEVVSMSLDPDHPRVVSPNDADVKVHMIHTVARAVVSFLAKQVTDHTVENMVLVAVESRVRDRQGAAAQVRAARDRVTADGGDLDLVVMAAAREVVKAARDQVVVEDMVVDMVGIRMRSMREV